jgi:hypothetical protein
MLSRPKPSKKEVVAPGEEEKKEAAKEEEEKKEPELKITILAIITALS